MNSFLHTAVFAREICTVTTEFRGLDSLSPLKKPPLFLTAFFGTVVHFVQSRIPPTLPSHTLSAPSSKYDNCHDDHLLSFNPSLA